MVKMALWSNWIDKIPQGFLWWFESTRCLRGIFYKKHLDYFSI